MEIRQRVIQTLSPCAAINIKGIAHSFQPDLECGQRVRVVLLHRQAADLGKVCRWLHGVKVPQKKVWLEPFFQTDFIARIGGDDEIAGAGPLPQTVKAPGGEDETAVHGRFSFAS